MGGASLLNIYVDATITAYNNNNYNMHSSTNNEFGLGGPGGRGPDIGALLSDDMAF